jgi:aspartyl/asparaginyl beta-hydroxylase (cupin superfamily)
MADETAIDALLEREPGNIAALVDKGECRRAAGDERGAVAFYKAALRAARAVGGPLPMALKPAIELAQQGIALAEGKFRDHQERYLTEAGFGEGSRPPRFQQALDILNGKVQPRMELQRPTSFYFPGLPQRRYFEASEFPWAAAIEAAAPSIRAEILADLGAGRDDFSPYMVQKADRPRSNFHGLVDNPQWSTLDLWDKGQPVPGLSARFPRTMTAVEATDLPRISVRAPNVLFSRLSAGARIPPHHGMLNTRLVCHLPLVVPPGCGFRVGGETREWHEGKLLIFDDTIEHEAWNEGSSDRIILIFDAWRPELDARERQAVAALFEAVDHY